MEYKTMDANEAVSRISYKFSEVCGIYPITPATPMAEKIDVLSNDGELNFFENKVKIVEMQSEVGAIAMVHGALQSGVLATTYTASQGLLLMIPTLYKLAGEMLPAVIHVAARSIATHALSIFGDHQDIYATRATGVCILASSSVNDAYRMAAIAHLSAIKASLPFINFFDGFRTSHEINKVKILNYDKIEKLIDKKALSDFRNRAMNNAKPNTRGTAQNEDIYFQNTESRNLDYMKTADIVSDYMEKINKIEKTNYKPFNYYGNPLAKEVIVAMGSVCQTIRQTVDDLNEKGYKTGLIEVHLYRPFSSKYLLNELPKSVEKIAVLDRTKEFGSNGEPLYLDVVNALKETNIKIIGGRYGLASKNTTPAMIKAVYDNLKGELKNNFTIGIIDDVTNLSLAIDDYKIDNKALEFLIYGYGSDGMVSTSKDIIKIIGDYTDYDVQGYFQYDSKKSGGVTRSHIRIANEQIRSPYYVDNPKLIVVSKDSYMYKYDILDNIKENGTLILNTNLSEEDLFKTLPNKVKYQLSSKKIKLYTIDAYKLVNELGLKNKINTALEICIFKIIKILDLKKVIKIIKENNIKRFESKGKKIIDINNSVVDKALEYLKEVKVDENFVNFKYEDKKNLSFDETINLLHGDELPVSAFLDKKNGVFKPGSTKEERRNIAENVPCWLKENCIECNNCVFSCPHGVIRAFVTDDEKDEIESIDALGLKDKKFSIAINYSQCTGCGVCVNACPGKMGNKALKMVENKNKDSSYFDYLLEHNVNDKIDNKILNVKNIGFTNPKFEYSGACAGCGETPYLKNLSQVYSNNLIIANATGCSSIYGASAPSTPYSIPWANSLFEDNSEFGLGILTGINVKRDKIKNYMLKYPKDKNFKKWLDNMNDYDICLEVKNNIDYKKHDYLNDLKDYITPSVVFIVGGDGFAYDIGYGGLDHVLSRNDNINILVLDTEVYSNTGGQASKSSNLGATASFAKSGKDSYKKDLARMAMCYQHVYVATTNIGYNKMQYLKVLKEAVAHDGPSLIIAYCPCIEHGIKIGMEHSQTNAYLATKCGYFPTFRSNPDTKSFTLDSTDVEFDKYEDYLKTENRFARLKDVNPLLAEDILARQKQWALDRYNYYKKLADNEK